MNRHWVVFFSSFLYSLTAGAAMPTEVGQTAFVKGRVLALHPDLEQRNLTQPSQGIFLKDRIETADQSFSVLEFLDKAKISVRPLSQFSVEDYVLTEHKASLKLDQGGIEVQMGEIGAQNPDELILKTPLATVSAQQGHFRVRLCGEDCAAEEQRKADKPAVETEVVARVAEIRGEVTAKSIGPLKPGQAHARKLSLGAPLYRLDEVSSGDKAETLLLFRDGGRISLGANSSMEIKDYRWQEPGIENHFALRLLRGGLRSMTGALGKADPGAISIETPVSLVGIRGTVFDLLLPEPKAGEEPELYSFVHQGEIELASAKAEPKRLKADEGSRQQADVVEAIRALPGDEALIGSDPRKARVDLVGDFGRHALAGAPSGLYVYALDGHVRIEGQMGPWEGRFLHLGRGGGAYVDAQGAIMRLDRPKNFQVWDMLEDEAEPEQAVPAVAPAVTAPPPPPPPGSTQGPPQTGRPFTPPGPTGFKPPPPVTGGCPPGTTWSKWKKSCLANNKASGCPAGQTFSKRTGRCIAKEAVPPRCPSGSFYSKRHGRCVTEARTSSRCPAGTFYSKRHGGCVREERQSSGASTAVKAAVGAAIAIGIIKAISGGRGGGHSHGGGGGCSGRCP